MNLAQMQMEYGQAPNGKVMLVPAKPQIKFRNGHNGGLTRARQALNRQKKSDYRPSYSRPRHDSEWK